MKTKTLKRAFLSKADNVIPIESIGIKLLPCFFWSGSSTASRRKEPVPLLNKHFRKIEDSLALLLLQVNPEDLIESSNKQAFVNFILPQLLMQHMQHCYCFFIVNNFSWLFQRTIIQKAKKFLIKRMILLFYIKNNHCGFQNNPKENLNNLLLFLNNPTTFLNYQKHFLNNP